MDTRTGRIYGLAPGQTVEQLAEQIFEHDARGRTKEQIVKDLTPLDQQPAQECPKCGGRGYVRKGLNSRRFKPCDCTLLKPRAALASILLLCGLFFTAGCQTTDPKPTELPPVRLSGAASGRPTLPSENDGRPPNCEPEVWPPGTR